MKSTHALVEGSLLSIGISSQRTETILQGAPLFGDMGILNSLELVQLIAAICDRTGGSVFDLMNTIDFGTSGQGCTINSLLGSAATPSLSQAHM